MKKTLASASFLVAATSAMIVSAAPPDLQGSDTLEEYTSDLVSTNCRGATNLKINSAAGGFLRYVGGGSGTASGAMTASFAAPTTTSQVAGPMSRAFNAAECTAANNPASAQGLVVGLDGVVVVGDDTASSTCGRSAGVAGMANLPVATASWKAQLTLLYTGEGVSGASDINRNCNTAARQTLAGSYASLFEGGTCTSTACTTIKHAYRRGDVSGTTDTFLNLIGAPAVVRTPAGTGPVTATPFCNGLENEDRDPLRRPCSQEEQVCEFDGTLGLVLPIVVPTASNNLSDLFNAGNAAGVNADPAVNGDVEPFGSFALTRAPACTAAPKAVVDASNPASVASATAVGLNLPTGAAFPNDLRCDCRFPVPESYTAIGLAPNPAFTWNKRFGGKCFGTAHPNPSGGNRYGVLNGDNGATDNSPTPWGNRFPQSGKNRCCRTGSPLTFYKQDPRLMNLVVRNPIDTAGPGTCLGGLPSGAGCPTPAFYRIHSTKFGLSVVGIPSQQPADVVCQDTDATRTIGCLVQAPGGLSLPETTCSVGYAGREAGFATVVGAIEGTPFAVGGAPPSVQAIQARIDSTLAPTPYPLSRLLFYNSLIGFGTGVLANNPAGASNYAEAQYDLFKCMADQSNSRAPSAQLPGGGFATKQALAKAGFVELPDRKSVV